MGILKNISTLISRIGSVIKHDPVNNCTLYKERGCVFVDGPFCDFPYCSMNKEFKECNVIVYSHADFGKFCESLNLNDDNVTESRYAFISIIGSKDVINDYLCEPDTKHYFNCNHSNVLNLCFDDVSEDFTFSFKSGTDGSGEKKEIHFYAMTDVDADRCVDFIEKNIGKTFIVHCWAGVSRSQAIFRFITDCYEKYKNCKGNLDNPCLTPNQDVVRKLKRAFYRRIGTYVE